MNNVERSRDISIKKAWENKTVSIVNEEGTRVDSIVTDVLWDFDNRTWFKVLYKGELIPCKRIRNTNNFHVHYEAYI